MGRVFVVAVLFLVLGPVLFSLAVLPIVLVFRVVRPTLAASRWQTIRR
jgi:hypothetical protein